MWRTLARNKKSVTIDLHTAEGQELVRRLAGRADAVIENYRPGKLESWGLGPDQLRRDNPKLVVVRISGYGQTRAVPRPGGVRRGRRGDGRAALPHRPPGPLADPGGHQRRRPARRAARGDRHPDGPLGARARLATSRARRSTSRCTRPSSRSWRRLIPEFAAYGVVRERSGNEIPGVAPVQHLPLPRRRLGGHRGQRRQPLPPAHDRDRPARPGRRRAVPGQPRAGRHTPAARRGDRRVHLDAVAGGGDGRDGGRGGARRTRSTRPPRSPRTRISRRATCC